MGNGTKLAVAIAIIFVAMVCFFFAFHPGGVQGVSDPQSMLNWLSAEFQNPGPGGGGNAPLDELTTPSTGQAPSNPTSPFANPNTLGLALEQGNQRTGVPFTGSGQNLSPFANPATAGLALEPNNG